MKRFVFAIIIFLYLAAPASAVFFIRGFTDIADVAGGVANVDCDDIHSAAYLAGGGTSSDDGIGFVIPLGSDATFYYFDESATDATSSPDYIRCKNYVDSGVWIKQGGGGQPLDSDLTAIAALTTTSFGRGLLEMANAAALLAEAGVVPVAATINTIDDCGTDELFVGGGAGVAPVCTTATGTAAPVRATGPTIAGATITADISFYDGSTDSPKQNFTDATNETFSVYKSDGSNLEIEINNAANRTVNISNAGAGDADLVVDGSITGSSLFEECVTAEPNDYVFGQPVCADGVTWNPSGQDWTGFENAEKKHFVHKVEPAAADCVAANDPHTCCTGSGAGATCSETWVVMFDVLGNVYFSGIPTETSSYSANQTLTAEEMKGGVIYVTSAATITPLAVFDGAGFTVITVGATAVSIDPNASDKIKLDGAATSLDDGDKIDNLSTAGDIAVCTYYSADGFLCITNGWSDGG